MLLRESLKDIIVLVINRVNEGNLRNFTRYRSLDRFCTCFRPQGAID